MVLTNRGPLGGPTNLGLTSCTIWFIVNQVVVEQKLKEGLFWQFD